MIETTPRRRATTRGTHLMRFVVSGAANVTHAQILIGKSASRKRLSWAEMTTPIERAPGVWAANVLYINDGDDA